MGRKVEKERRQLAQRIERCTEETSRPEKKKTYEGYNAGWRGKGEGVGGSCASQGRSWGGSIERQKVEKTVNTGGGFPFGERRESSGEEYPTNSAKETACGENATSQKKKAVPMRWQKGAFDPHEERAGLGGGDGVLRSVARRR